LIGTLGVLLLAKSKKPLKNGRLLLPNNPFVQRMELDMSMTI
jgi:hypothetical protein